MTSQPGLFDQHGPNLDRVRATIAPHIKAYCLQHRQFHADDLREYVVAKAKAAQTKVAPASADRILRDLRQSGEIDYVVVNRRASLYEVLEVREVISGDK